MERSERPLASDAKLERFVRNVLGKLGVPEADATIVANVLVHAELRGIASHGVARLERDYVRRIRAGSLDPAATAVVVAETPTSLVVDARNGLGEPAAARAMRSVLDKAEASGAAFGTVRHSNDFGIAGYYAMLALERDMIGIASTNAARDVAPTFGGGRRLGANPLAYAVPAGSEPPFVLDFATTAASRGAIERDERAGRELPDGWALDGSGNETRSARDARDGALLPLGGRGTDNGGHKGYGLGLLVDILCGVLSGGGAETDSVAHFFGAIRIDGFRDVAHFKRDVDKNLRAFKDSRKAPGVDRIFVAGEIEHERTIDRRANGIPIADAVWSELRNVARDVGVPFDVAR